MTHTVTVTHTFEAGHRLPCLPGKCQSLHGHSWKVEVTVESNIFDPTTGTIVQFGLLKAALRSWVDAHLDHGLILGRDDELIPLLKEHGKIFVLNETPLFRGALHLTPHLIWPSVESIAALIAKVMIQALEELDAPLSAHVSRVRVSETPTNSATWEHPE